MTSPETFIAFTAIMIVIALIGAAIDWVGAPLRHRRFVPKAYRFPDERLFRNESLNNPDTHSSTSSSGSIYFKEETVPIESDESFQPGNSIRELTLEDSIKEGTTDGTSAELGVDPLQHRRDKAPVELEQEKSSTIVQDEIKLPLQEGLTPPKRHEGTLRLRGWKPGGYIYNLTQDGRVRV